VSATNSPQDLTTTIQQFMPLIALVFVFMLVLTLVKELRGAFS
jgi:hypothetical protein